MSLQILLSAMHLTDFSLAKELNIKTDAIIINQCNEDEKQLMDKADAPENVMQISTLERGLSKSRNMAIRNATADICILCDNDVIFENNAKTLIEDAYKRNPNADVIVFFINRPERRQPVFDIERELGYDGAMRIFSPEISFKREALDKYKLLFNEEFGAGAKYSMGEENIFLFEAIGKGMKVMYCPIEIAHLKEDNESTWFKGYTDKFFVDRGANYYAMTSKWHVFLILQFALRKYKLYKNDCSILKAIRYMFLGAAEYKNCCRNIGSDSRERL